MQPSGATSRRSWVKHRAISGALLLLAAPAASQPANEPSGDPVFGEVVCNPPPQFLNDRLEELIALVNSHSISRIREATERYWHSEAQQSLSGAQLELVRWSAASENLQEERVCVTEDGAFGEYRNSLSGAVDRVEIIAVSGADRRLARLMLREGFRIAPHPVHRGPDRDRIERLDAFLGEWADRDLFSGVVLVARGGEPIYWRAFGNSNREAQLPFRRDTPVNLASLNKIFTAVAVMQLVEQGALRLDQSIEEAAPEVLAHSHGSQIQIRHLLSHTSGLTDASGREHPSAEPGRSQRYANVNFAILGEIIEHVAGMRLEDYLRLAVFGPAEMARTGRFELARPTAALAMGYTPELSENRIAYRPNPLLHTIPGGAMGGYFSNAPDLLRFATALQAGQLLSLAGVADMRAVHRHIGAQDYGLGVIRWRGPGIWGHAGDLPGTDADLEIYGDSGYVAIVLGNRTSSNSPVLAKIRSLFFPQGASGPTR